MARRKILTVVGARPQFIKAAPVSRAIAAGGAFDEVMVHTGQHFDAGMSDVFFEELAIPAPKHVLGIHGGGHGTMTGRMMIALEDVILAEKPDVVLIYGDTNSTLAGAVVAAKLYLPIGHVEAGLRSFRAMPEETNRVLADRVSQWLFCPTSTAVENLRREGLTSGVHQIGDVMFDVALMMRDRARQRSTILARIGAEKGKFQLATLHRAENTDTRDALAHALDYLRAAAAESALILPLHPRTRQAAERFGLDFGQITVIEPVGYLDMIALVDGCMRVLTDSGGLQKEAYFFRKPCITLRDATEWVETIEAGWNRLWRGPDYAPRCDIAEYGEGTAAEKLVAVLRASV